MTKEEEKKLLTLDRPRLAYMVAWRERYIARLQDLLAGREEENDMLQALLYYALVMASREEDGSDERVIHIPRREITAQIGTWTCRATAQGEDYVVRFSRTKAVASGETDGAPSEAE